MEGFEGIVSLLIACLEVIFLINILIFAQRNHINKLIIVLVGLLFVYQVYEFSICYFGINSSLTVYLAFLSITFLPPLSLLIILELSGIRKKKKYLIFVPALFFIFYYPAVLESFQVTKCTLFYAVYEYPLGDLYGAFYYLPVLLSIAMLFRLLGRNLSVDAIKLLKILLAGYIITFIPAGLIFFVFPSLAFANESIFCKLAVILALTYTYFALKFKDE